MKRIIVGIVLMSVYCGSIAAAFRISRETSFQSIPFSLKRWPASFFISSSANSTVASSVWD